MIEVEHVSRRFGDFTAVDDVSFHIGRGEIVGLLGHNGAGKTTLMKMITGFLEPSSGSIRIDGLSMDDADPKAKAAIQSRIGYLPENCPTYPEMTVLDYLDYQASLHDVPKQGRTSALARAIELTELTPKAYQPIQTLSRGYRQRVGVAQAILHRPEIVILDEPANGLDPTQIQHMRDLIRTLCNESTIILSTHILQEVQAVCKRVVIMNNGRKAVDSRLDELQRSRRMRVIADGDAGAVLTRFGRVERLNGGAWAVEADEDQAAAISAAIHEAGLPLRGLSPERHDLETVFAQTSTGPHVKQEVISDAA